MLDMTVEVLSMNNGTLWYTKQHLPGKGYFSVILRGFEV